MFGFLESTLKAAASVVSVPVTLGGSLTDKDRPYTADACSDLVKNVQGMTKPNGD